MFNYRYLWKWKRTGQSKTVQNKETQRSGSYKYETLETCRYTSYFVFVLFETQNRLLQLQKRYTSKNVDSNGKEA